MCCYFRLTAGETGEPRGVCWARERGPRGGALGHGAVLVVAAREPVAISEVVIWRYRSMCTAASLGTRTNLASPAHVAPVAASLHQRQ